MPARRNRRRASAATAAMLLGTAALTGCIPQVRDDAERYEEILADVPGVIDVTMTVSTPLPFTVQASVDAVVPDDQDVVDALVDAACGARPNATIDLDLIVRADSVDVGSTVGGACPEIEQDLVGIASSIRDLDLSSPVAVELAERGDDLIAVEFGDDVFLGTDILDAADAVATRLDAPRTSIDSPTLQLPAESTETVVQRLADLRTIDRSVPITGATLIGDGLVLSLDEADDEAGVDADTTAEVESQLRDLSSGLWTDLDIEITDGVGAILSGASTGAGPAGVRLVTWISEELGLYAVATGSVVDVQVDDIQTIVSASEQIAAHNPDGMRVTFSIFTEPTFSVSPQDEIVLSPEDNPYPEWVAWWQELADTGEIGSVEVGSEGLSVWLRADLILDEDAKARVDAVVSRIARDAGLDWYRVNNRTTAL